MKIKISDDLFVNYVKLGNGPHTVLLLPGTLGKSKKSVVDGVSNLLCIIKGTIEKDFTPQLEGLNKEKFTIVAWDPPGLLH